MIDLSPVNQQSPQPSASACATPVSTAGCDASRKRKSHRLSSSKRGRAKQVKFADTAGKKLVTIEKFFSRSYADHCLSKSVQSTENIDDELSQLICCPEQILSASKGNITAFAREHAGGMSCGNITLSLEDLMSLLPGKWLIDNVSL